MQQAVARVTLAKARYFLSEAIRLQSNPAVTRDRIPFAATLESAIVYGRSTLDHLKYELESKPDYLAWHDKQWASLEANGPFRFLRRTRNIVIHDEPISTTATLNLQATMTDGVSMSVVLTLIRAGGTIVEVPSKASAPPDLLDGTDSMSVSSQAFYFADSSWRKRPAVEYIADYLNMIEAVVSRAEQRFL